MGLKTLDFPSLKERESGLQINFKVIIPSTRDETDKINRRAFEHRVDEMIKFIHRSFTGSTVNYGIGTYELNDKIIREDVAIISVFTDAETYNARDEILKRYLKEKKHSWGQKSISFEYEGDVFEI